MSKFNSPYKKDWICPKCDGSGDTHKPNGECILNEKPSEPKCERCKDWQDMGLSDTCPSCDEVANELRKQKENICPSCTMYYGHHTTWCDRKQPDSPTESVAREPMEFWIPHNEQGSLTCIAWHGYHKDLNPNFEPLHVIEYSAYEKLKGELAEAKDEGSCALCGSVTREVRPDRPDVYEVHCSNPKCGHTYLPWHQEVKYENILLNAERDALKAELAEVKNTLAFAVGGEYNAIPVLKAERDALTVKLKVARDALERLTLVGPPSRPTTGLEYAQVALEDNCAIAEAALKRIDE